MEREPLAEEMHERGAVPASEQPALRMSGVSFSYAAEGERREQVLHDVSCTVPQGSFALLVGGTGSGKTTLLRLAKPELAPVGERGGSIAVCGHDVNTLDAGESAQLVGYVFQNPDNQIVCDTVWHELAFGLENLGLSQAEMRRRLSEVCIYLGIEHLFRSRCSELSGGQRQVVALAAVLAMRPRLLLLDEPTAMLDPVAEHEFLSLLFRANRELGITVVVATHAPATMRAYATQALMLEAGTLHEIDPEVLPAAPCLGTPLPRPSETSRAGAALALHDVWARYGRDGAWVLRGCDLTVAPGEVRALMGGNGSGKSTLLAIAAGTLKAQRGRVRGNDAALRHRALLPQQPKALLGCATVADELSEWANACGYGAQEVQEALERLGVRDNERHPYDLSGGQQQLLALEKLLLTNPQLLLLDEPTKGLDAAARSQLAERVRSRAAEGCAVVVATHDAAFARAVAHGVTLLFDGQAGEAEPVETFFEHSWMWRA